MDEDLQKHIEAVLFSLGKKVHVKDIMRMTKQRDQGVVTAALIELKNRYNNDAGNSLMILQDGDEWKLTIKDKYTSVAKDIGIDTELPKTIIETLADIAYKNPVLQSDVIKVRTNKAYDHLSELEKLGYISREKKGRTKLIRLAPKFFEYFDLPADSLRSTFANVAAMEQVIKEKEHQIHAINQQKEEQVHKQKLEDKELEKKNIYLQGIPQPNPHVAEQLVQDSNGMAIIAGEKLGQLEVYADKNTVAASDDTNSDNLNSSTSSSTPVGNNGVEFDINSSKNDSFIDESVDVQNHDLSTSSPDLTLDLSNTNSSPDSFDSSSNTSDLTYDNITSPLKVPYTKKGVDDLAAALADSIDELMKKKNAINKVENSDDLKFSDNESTDSSLNSDLNNTDSLSSNSNLSNTPISSDDSLVDSSLVDSSLTDASSDGVLKEMSIFPMKGLSKETMEQIEEKSDAVLGLKHTKKSNLPEGL